MLEHLRLRHPAVLAWIALVVSTLAAWWAGTDHGFGDSDTALKVTTVFVLVVAFVKVQLVVRYFMEVRHAPRALRMLFGGYGIVVCAGLCVMYLVTS